MAHLEHKFLLITLCNIIYGLLIDALPVVQTSNGLVSGFKDKSVKGRDYYGFTGIPYAQSPAGSLRFKPPVPVSNWTGTLDATKSCEVCPQWSGGYVVGSEDCLCLNVYTPQLPSNGVQTLPVMVFIHGGSFVAGYIGGYGPQRFMDHNVIIVLVAYRLGALGYLCTGDSASPGNYGSLDNVEALRWVQKNIGSFGGDRKKVIVVGESAGAASADYLRLAPNINDLFYGVISQSGTSSAKWAFQKNPLSMANQLAVNLNCPTVNTTAMVDCIRKASITAIILATGKVWNARNFLSFGPCAEDPQKGLFLRDDPSNLLRSGKFNKVPIIMGTNRDEGLAFYQGALQGSTVLDENYFISNFQNLIKVLTTVDDPFQFIADAAKVKYFKNVNFSNQKAAIQAFVDLFTDSMFNAPTQFTAQMTALQGAPFYAYSFEFINQYYEEGVNHGQEWYYLWYASQVYLPPPEQQMSDLMVNMWVNFAYNLTPSSQWQPTTSSKELQYLRMANDKVAMNTGYRTSSAEFWNEDVSQINDFEGEVINLWAIFWRTLHL